MITHSNTVRNLITGSPKRNKTIAAIAVVILASIIMIFLLIQGSDKLKLEVTVTLDGKPLAETHVEILDSKIKPLVTDKTGKCLFDNLNFQNKEKIRILVNVDEHTHKLKTHVIDAGIDINKVKIFIGQESTYLILNTLHDNISWEIYDTQNSTHIQSGTGSDKIEIPQNKSIDLIYMLRGIDESKFEKRHDIKTGPIIDNLKIYKLEIIPENEFLIYTLKDVNNGEIYAESNGHKLFYFDKENSIIIQYLTLDGEMIEDIRLNDTNYSKRVNLKGNPPEDDSNYYVTIKVSPNSAEWKVIDRKNNSTQNEGYGQQTIQLARGSYLIKEKCDHGDCKEKEFVISNSDKTIDFNLRSFTLNIFTSPTDKPWELITPAGTKITGTTPMIIDREITRGKYRARAKRANGDWTSWIRKTVDRSDITIKIDVSLPCLRPKLYINVIPPDISWKIEKKIKFPGDWITFYSGVGNDAIDVKNDQTYRVSVKVKDNEKLSDLFVFSHVHETCVENVTFDFTDCNNQIYVSLGDDERLAELADSCYTGDFVLECDYFLPLAE